MLSASVWGATWTQGNVRLTLSGTTFTLSALPGTDGAMTDLTQAETLWRTSSNRSNIRTVVIEEGVTYIGAYTFYYCLNITSIKIPTSLTSFGEKVFLSSNGTPKIYYAGTPNEWANIDFVDGYSHPFYGSSSSTHHFYFYNQTSTETKIIVFTPGITTIKPYTFYFAGNITDVNIPHSVSSIGAKAFHDCGNLCRLFVLNTNAPTTDGTDIFKGMLAGASASWLYLPVGANASTSAPGFKRLPWYDNAGEGKGAARIGYQGTDKSASTGSSGFGIADSKVYPTSGTVDGISWNLDNDGVLTLNGTGAITTSFVTGTGNDALYPWWRWHNLVTKVVIKGGITGLSNALSRFDALVEIEIQQGTIPTSSSSVPTAANYILNDQITLRIPLALIDDPQLDEAPWNGMKVTISETAVIDENVNNLDFLDALHNKLSAPFNMQLVRSLSNAYYNTYCSPINMDAALVASTFGAGTRIHALTGTECGDNDSELTLVFGDSQDYMDAGVPYIIWPANNVSNPTFTDVDPADVASLEGRVDVSHVSFRGTLAPRTVTAAEIAGKNFIFLQANNRLNWANTGTLKGMRAYWLLTDEIPVRALAHSPIMRIGNAPQGIEDVNEQASTKTQKIMRNGQLIIVRDGIEYNAQGIRL